MLAHVHDYDGHWLGSLTQERLTHLRHRFDHARCARPGVSQRLQAGPFETELALLLKRWKAATHGWQAGRMQSNHAATPTALIDTIRQVVGAETELFASPLNVSPGMPSYLSADERDQLFGAGWDAYRHCWEGVSYAYPPETPHDIEVALRYALACALGTTRQVLTVMLLPAWRDAPHTQWLSLPQVTHLATLPPRSLIRHNALGWTGQPSCCPPTDCPGYHLVAVGNCNALAASARQALGTAGYLAGRAGGSPSWPAWTDIPAASRPQHKPPKRYLDAAANQVSTRLALRLPTDGAPTAAATVSHTYSTQYQPRYHWQAAYYTDGSVCSTGTGSAVGAGVYSAEQDQCFYINTNGQGQEDTITRAELAALHYTVTQLLAPPADPPPGAAPAEPDSGGLIFTDSQVALHLLNRMLHRPHTLEGHLHRDLVKEIVEGLVARANQGLRTRILKVKAHTGVAGNERADTAAKEAGKLMAGDHDYTTPEHVPFGGRWMPAFPAPHRQDAANTAAGADTPLHAVGNLRGALRKALHKPTKTGSSKVGAYATSWRATNADPDGALPAESNAMWTTPGVSSSTIRLVLQSRMGTLWTARRAQLFNMRYLAPSAAGPAGTASDGTCPLCRLPDSVGHMLGRCQHKQMQAMIIKRHDAAVRKVAQALQRRTRQGGCYTVMDACKAVDLETHGVDAKRLPSWILPDAADAGDLCKQRPDILRILGLPASPTDADIQQAVAHKRRHRIQIVEVGYTSDTRWKEKLAEKQVQHERLRAQLADAGWDVDPEEHVILLGTAGTVYRQSLRALEAVGLQRNDAKALLRKLHIMAITTLRDIVATRRRLERRTGVG